MTTRPVDRNNDLARIHILAGDLGMDTRDEHPASEYRAMLFAVGGPAARRPGAKPEISAAHLDHVGRAKVCTHLAQLARMRGIPERARGERKPRPTPAPDRLGSVKKIRAMLKEAGRDDAYGDALAKRMFHVERYEWLQAEQLRRMIAALMYDRGRRRARAARQAEGRA